VAGGRTNDAQPIAQTAKTARQKAPEPHTMMSRTTASATTGRASAMRRMRRRSRAATRPYCATNGCPSFLEVDDVTGMATCPICGYTRHLH
jgi:hypothetical protein